MKAVYEYLDVNALSLDELETATTEYFDAEAPTYDNFDGRVERRAAYMRGVNLYIGEALRRTRVRRVLSFGCGTGRRELEIAELGSLEQTSFTGIERSNIMAAYARGRLTNVYVSLEDLANHSSPDFFDGAICLYSFIHLTTEDARLETLTAIRDRLSPGALIMLDVFNLYDKHEWKSKLSDGGTGTPPALHGPHRGDVVYRRLGQAPIAFMHYFTPAEVCSLVESAGYVLVDLQAVGHGLRPGTIGVPLDEGCLLVTARKP